MNPESSSTSHPNRLGEILWPSLFLLVTMLNLTLIVAGLKELIIDELGGTEADASWFFSIEMVAYVIFAPLWGLVSDRLGRRKPLIVIGFFASAALYASYSAVTSVSLLLTLRFVQGAFTVMGWSTLMAMVVDRADGEHRGRYLGLMGASLIFGVSIGAPLGGYVSRSWGAHAPLQAAAVLFFLLALGSLLMSEGTRREQQISTREILTALRSRPRLLLPAIFYFVDRYTVGFIVVLFPLYLASLGVDDPAVRGRYLGNFLIPFAFLQYFTGRLTERIGPLIPLIGGSLLYGIALCTVGYSDLAGLWWVMTILGILASVMFPPAIVMTAEYSDPATRGSAMGGFNLAGSVGFAIGPVVGVWAHQNWGYGFAFVLAGTLEIAIVLAAIGFLWYWKRTPDDETPDDSPRVETRG